MFIVLSADGDNYSQIGLIEQGSRGYKVTNQFDNEYEQVEVSDTGQVMLFSEEDPRGSILRLDNRCVILDQFDRFVGEVTVSDADFAISVHDENHHKIIEVNPLHTNHDDCKKQNLYNIGAIAALLLVKHQIHIYSK